MSIRELRPTYYRTLTKIRWGYERDAHFDETSYSWNRIDCESEEWDVEFEKNDRRIIFWNQADFGYVKQRLDSMRVICEANGGQDSSLVCSDHLHYCYAKNITFDFANLKSNQHTNRYREDVIQKGQVIGNCKLNQRLLVQRADQKSPLQSWAAELMHFETTGDLLNFRNCDKIFDRPAVIMKLDAGVSMYHHFCDFINLYASQHINDSFSKDVQVVIWDTSGRAYNDLFYEVWKAFTNFPLIQISDFDRKKVHGCSGSGLFHAFSKQMLRRLAVVDHKPVPGKIRITLLSRNTKYRRISNEDVIFKALKTVGEYDVRKVDFDRGVKFVDQLAIIHNSDVLVGMHGSGLTHVLFLPDWAALFEIYNCGDVWCYYDLARLRGVKYVTWKRQSKIFPEDQGHHPTMGAHKKFTNYAFDVEEFMGLVAEATDHVRSHPTFVSHMRQQHASLPKDEL